MPSSSRARWLALVVLSFAVLCFGQGKRSAEPPDERDHPREREQWFRRGRPSDNGGSAEKLRRAYEQKLEKRAARRAQLSQRKTSVTLSTATTSSAQVSATSVPASGAVWTPLGPAPLASDSSGTGSQDYGWVTGRATAVAVDQNDQTGNTVYLGGAFGGLWKSTNAAGPVANVTWTPLLDGEATLAVGAIAIQPNNSNVVLVGTGESNSSSDSYYGLGILRSMQGGAPGSWALITTANSSVGALPFRGLTFSRIAFSTDNPNLVVAATTAAGVSVGGELGTQSGTSCTPGASCRGMYYSTDGGATWSYAASLHDLSGATPNLGSAHSVVYNPSDQRFYTALRGHGIYFSTDGANWTQTPTQPGGISSTTCPAATNLNTCPLYRAEIALLPGRNEMYVWLVDSNENNKGIYQTLNSGASWTALSISGIDNCGDKIGTDLNGCSTEQGNYNLDLAAVPSGSGTDVYAGAVNQFKCTIIDPTNPASCSFVNLTHVYGCSPWGSYSHVHPDEHSIDFVRSNPAIIYFANDGGIYRTLNSFLSGVTGACGSTPTYPFDNLNGTMGSMTQFVSFSHHPADSATLLGGTQDNGSPATASGGTTQSWNNVNNGDGGYNEINPNNPTDWFTSNTYVSIQRCGSGINCTSGTFTGTVMGPPNGTALGSDYGAFYVPYMLDPQNSNTLLVGTCRVWRGGSNGALFSALSNPNFSSALTAACPKSDDTKASYVPDNISALAAGGPKSATTNNSQVIYVGTEGYSVSSTARGGGKLWVTTNADGGAATWVDRTSTINPKSYPVSSIALDPSDPTGNTAYATIMGFDVGHVFRTLDAGATWVDISGDLPNAPADAVVVDPGNPNFIYVGTDVGVFFTTNGGANWTELGLDANGAGTLPNVALTRLKIFSGGATEHLRVSTYGRGIWDIDLGTATAPTFVLTVANPTVSVMPGTPATLTGTLTPVNGFSGSVTLSCSGDVPGTCTPDASGYNLTGKTNFSVSVATSTGGDFTFDLVASGSGVTQVQSVTVHVTDFAMTAISPSSVTVPHGASSATIQYQLIAQGGFSGVVNLVFSGLPTGATAGNAATSATLTGANSPLTMAFNVDTLGSTAAGTYTITLTATSSGASTKTQSFSLVIVINPDFLLPSNPPSMGTIKATQTLNGNFTIGTQDGYTGTLNLSCSGAPCTVPASVVVPDTNPIPVTVTPDVTSGGSLNLAIMVQSPTATKSFQMPYTVQNYVATVGPSHYPAALPGTTLPVAVSIISQGAYQDSVNASCDVSAIAGATCTLSTANPISVATSGASLTATVNVPQNTALGLYPVGVTIVDSSLPALTHKPGNSIAVMDFSLGASPSTTSIKAGATATFGLTATPTGNNTASAWADVNFSCSGLPSLATCTFMPSTIQLANVATPTTLSITTTAAIASVHPSRRGTWALAFCLPLLGLAIRFGARRRKVLLVLLMAVFAMLILLQACGGGSGGGGGHPGTPAGTYTVTVSGTMNGVARTTTVTLTVQ